MDKERKSVVLVHKHHVQEALYEQFQNMNVNKKLKHRSTCHYKHVIHAQHVIAYKL